MLFIVTDPHTWPSECPEAERPAASVSVIRVVCSGGGHCAGQTVDRTSGEEEEEWAVNTHLH